MKSRCSRMLAMTMFVAVLTGCQNWSNLSGGLYNPTRVPPPGTGSIQPQTGYYNNSNSTTPPNQAKAPSTSPSVSNFRPVNSGRAADDPAPSPNLNARSPIAQASFESPNRPSTSRQPTNEASISSAEYTAPEFNSKVARPATDSLSDSPNNNPADLKWR